MYVNVDFNYDKLFVLVVVCFRWKQAFPPSETGSSADAQTICHSRMTLMPTLPGDPHRTCKDLVIDHVQQT